MSQGKDSDPGGGFEVCPFKNAALCSGPGLPITGDKDRAYPEDCEISQPRGIKDASETSGHPLHLGLVKSHRGT